MRHLSGLERARSALDSGKRIPAGALPTPVARSWLRCVDIGLDPNGTPLTAVVEARDLRERRGQRELLRRMVIAEMQFLYSQIAGSNFMIAFADPDGVVLDTISDHHFAATPTGRSIIPGSMWKEQIRGTNALGLVLQEKAAASVYGREHYFACNGQASCIAVPIFDCSQRIVGILDASCAQDAHQHHTMVLVRMATTQIENSLIFHEQANQLILAFHPRVEYLYTLSAGIVAVSGDGGIQSVNGRGLVLLHGLDAARKLRFEDVFDADFSSTAGSLLKGGITQVRDRSGGGLFIVCRQVGGQGRFANSAAVARSTAKALPRELHAPFICKDRRVAGQMASVAEVVKSRIPIHITGETGTGKELIARHVHECSGRKGEFVAVNCGAISGPLLVAELFGYEKGAFTNARAEGSIGLIRQADKGTLFLDEVGEIPLCEQAAFLRFLDTMEVRPVGGLKTATVDVQIVSATNRLLEQEVAHKRFRADLFYRLNALEVTLPPLREREDFLEIVRFLMDRVAPGVAITDAAIECLRRRPWPGNFRELRSTLQRLAIQCGESHIDEGLVTSFCGAAVNACPDCLGHPLRRAKCAQIRDSYHTTGRNVSEVARLLRISRTTIYKHVRDLPVH
jgi:transcriptional regulator of acetoin/glycerol metabolism